VTPGDILRLEVTLTTLRSKFGKAHAKATVDGELAAEGELLFGVAARDETGA
jgi:3-hydroxyacyl-[acyl-carrier-protein] dehydratase